jgi:hypothetical protein
MQSLDLKSSTRYIIPIKLMIPGRLYKTVKNANLPVLSNINLPCFDWTNEVISVPCDSIIMHLKTVSLNYKECCILLFKSKILITAIPESFYKF